MRRFFVMAGAALLAAAGNARGWNAGDSAHGFRVTEVCALPEVGGRMVRMTFEQNGAELAWLDRDDDNMTFSIAFRTIPGDDSGVAHILEHSVLCGSKRYPVKEPFVELLKGSFATYLNAWTAADCTMYPVCSRNAADFRNLISVYLDAVFHPLSVETDLAFRQEGWHWELNEEGKLVRNGVVYNEMKGAFASPERLAYHEAMRMLFPDNCYRYVSGGDPAAIGNLTFGQYREFWRRHYHPSNARIFLDGRVDIERTLELLGGVLREFGRAEATAAEPLQKAVGAKGRREYELGAGESAENKTLLTEGWVVGETTDIERRMAFGVLADVLAGSNEDALAKALLKEGLCEDVRLGVGGSAQIVALLNLKNVKDGKVDAARETVRRTLRELSEKGLDRARLAAVIDRHEFNHREKDYGGFPRGLAFMGDALDMWLYGGNPADAFRAGGVYGKLRKKAGEGWFEKLLKETLVENAHHAELELVPSAELAGKRAKAEREELDGIYAKWTEGQKEKMKAEAAELKAHQQKPDAAEDLAKLPQLEVKDIPEEGPAPQMRDGKAGGVEVKLVKTAARGIAYAELYFSLEDFTLEELADMAVAAGLLGELGTAKRDAIALKNAMDAGLGRFEAGVGAYGAPGKPEEGKAYLTVKLSALEGKSATAAELTAEALLETRFDDPKRIGDLLKQRQRAMERGALGLSGRLFAQKRAAAWASVRGTMEEWLSGFEHLRRLQKVNGEFGEKGGEYCARLGALMKRAAGKARLTAGISDNAGAGWLEPLVAKLPEGTKGAAAKVERMPKRNEGYSTAGRVGSAAKGGWMEGYRGEAVVAARMLSLDYLWTEIRVKGGAYGGGCRVRAEGDAGYLSWNDPQLERSLGVYGKAGDALRAAAGAEPVGKYIVSAVAATEPYLTPSVETTRAMDMWLGGRTAADLQRLRREMLATTPEKLKAFAGELDAMAAGAATCVVGGAAQVEKCRGAGLVGSVEAVAAGAGGK